MNIITFKPEHHGLIQALLNSIKKNDPNPYLTFIIKEPSEIMLIGGSSDALTLFRLSQGSEAPLPKGAWSISASAFVQYWAGQNSKIKGKEPIVLSAHYAKHSKLPTLEGITDLHAFRYAEAQTACQHHLTFFDSITTKPFDVLPTHKAIELLNVADQHRPFEVFEVSKEEALVRIERDNDVLPFPLPETLDVDFNMTLTSDATHSLEALATTTDSAEISVYLDDEQAIFSDEEQTFSHSLAPLRAYREKQQQSYTQAAKIIIEHFGFKQEIRDFKKIEEVRQTNQALIYLTPSAVYLAALSSVGSVMRLESKQIDVDSPQLYAINLNALAKVKIRDITTAKAIKLCVLKTTQGELKLAFYNDKDNEHSYDSVPLELAATRLPELKRRIAQAQNLDRDNFGEQDDLFGFDDV